MQTLGVEQEARYGCYGAAAVPAQLTALRAPPFATRALPQPEDLRYKDDDEELDVFVDVVTFFAARAQPMLCEAQR